eukprot:gnl/Trimastix_PCT/2827.p1 GENE.gnl/Trimastix_PCT/2827~~gnl/Trimastix_PCT/2827.p1  ORF type:complete len:186 (+),score=41.73 gnl/Trimastix_PCT/2827:81-638(+)
MKFLPLVILALMFYQSITGLVLSVITLLSRKAWTEELFSEFSTIDAIKESLNEVGTKMLTLLSIQVDRSAWLLGLSSCFLLLIVFHASRNRLLLLQTQAAYVIVWGCMGFCTGGMKFDGVLRLRYIRSMLYAGTLSLIALVPFVFLRGHLPTEPEAIPADPADQQEARTAAAAEACATQNTDKTD